MKRWVLAGLLTLSMAPPGVCIAATDAASTGYATAFGLMRAGSFGLAETAWRNFLRQYPDHPLAASAQYFLGETFFGRSDFSRAAIAYAAGIEKYPRSDVAPQTLLKLGIALGRTGETVSACDAFARLDRQFPEASGVVQERAMVERRQYHCPDTSVAQTPAAQTPAVEAPTVEAPTAPIPAVAAARAPSEETPVKLAAVAAPATATAVKSAVPPTETTQPPSAPALSPPSATPPGGSVPDRSAMPDKAAELEPAPPAQPLTPVERKALTGLDAERAAAKAALYVTPPPAATHRASAKAENASHAASSSPEAIKAAQILLAALSYDAGPVDGQPGAKLHESVRTFEKRNGMRPDGEVSDQLLQRLSAAVAARKAPAPAAPTAATPARLAAGTGFIVSRSGFVVTSSHLVAGCKEIRARSLGADDTEASLVALDARNDLALLRLKSQTDASVAAVSFRDGRGPRHGDGVVVTGLSLGDDGSSNFYLMTGIVNALSGGRDDSGIFKVSAPISADSGSTPVFDTSGHVVAILSDGLSGNAAGDATTRTGLALRATIARNFLDAHNVDYDSAPATSELKASEIGNAAKEVVVLVECRR